MGGGNYKGFEPSSGFTDLFAECYVLWKYF